MFSPSPGTRPYRIVAKIESGMIAQTLSTEMKGINSAGGNVSGGGKGVNRETSIPIQVAKCEPPSP